jgi:predicted NBD/HSP70 family sugar kinase
MAALAAAWQAGEASAVRTVETVAEYLAAGVANLVNLVNPDLVVLDGWVTGVLGDALMPELERRLPSHAMEAPLKAARLKRNEQERNMVALGAAALALEGHLSRLNTVGSRNRR